MNLLYLVGLSFTQNKKFFKAEINKLHRVDESVDSQITKICLYFIFSRTNNLYVLHYKIKQNKRKYVYFIIYRIILLTFNTSQHMTKQSKIYPQKYKWMLQFR